MALKSVIDLLAEQQETVLIGMRDALRADSARINVELQQVEEALAKKARRGGRRPGGRTQREGLTRWIVFDVVKEQGRAVSPTEVRDILRTRGFPNVTTPQVRNHMARLADVNKSLVRLPDTTYVLPSANGGNARNETDKPLFTDTQSQRDGSS